MNYERIYDRLIDRSKGRVLTGYKEKHHIVPSCLGGTDERENLSVLTAREHYVAHLLLVKMFPKEPRLVFAAHMMTLDKSGRRYGNRKYEWLRKKHSIAIGLSKIGNTYNLGKKHSEQTRLKISAANKGQNNRLGFRLSEETKRKISERHIGKSVSMSTRDKMSESQFLARRKSTEYSTGEPVYFGITQRPNGRFVARRRVNGKREYVGYFNSLSDAKTALGAH